MSNINYEMFVRLNGNAVAIVEVQFVRLKLPRFQYMSVRLIGIRLAGENWQEINC